MGSKDEETWGDGEGEGDNDGLGLSGLVDSKGFSIGSELQLKHTKTIIKYKKRIGGRTSPATLSLTSLQ
ncbi:MAG: hypothetical protein HYU97_03255 [Deltaproteobacteria bacterium]|nr:hypothetical protein [Deltaproteobacteria bacterium]